MNTILAIIPAAAAASREYMYLCQKPYIHLTYALFHL